MGQTRHIGVTLALIGICLISNIPAQAGPGLQPFTAQYQLSRGRMLIGKVTNSLRLEADGSYTYTSVTKPVGIVAAFSDDLITETSQGHIRGNQVTPSLYTYEHKRKKRPKFRKQQFDWSTNRLSMLAPKPVQTIDIPTGTQDKASMVLSMMYGMQPTAKEIRLQVADKDRVKEYLMGVRGKEQIKAGGSDYDAFKLTRIESGQKPSIAFWLAPQLNYLPVQIEKLEKKDTYTMTLVEYTPGQMETGKQSK